MLDRFRRLIGLEAKSLAAPSADFSALFGAVPSASGYVVTPATAMQSTPVRAAVQAIAEPIGQLPLHVYRRDGDGRERDTTHPVARLLTDPNDWTSSGDFREQLQRDCLLAGNGYAFINRVDGRPLELLRLDPCAMTVEADATTGEPIYKLKTGSKAERLLDRRDVFHLKAPSLNGVAGDSPVHQCREAIGVALIMERNAAKLFANGARPGGVIEFPKNIGDAGLAKMKAAWRAAHEGADNTGKTAVLWDGATFRPATFSSVDAQFLELWQHSITEIARIFRVPPHMLYELGRATWGNAGEMGASFLQFSLMRWLKAWQGEIRLKLFTEAERDTFYAEFQTNDFLKADLSARATAYSTLIAARVLNPNEARAMENRPPYAGGDQFANPNITTARTDGNNG